MSSPSFDLILRGGVQWRKDNLELCTPKGSTCRTEHVMRSAKSDSLREKPSTTQLGGISYASGGSRFAHGVGCPRSVGVLEIRGRKERACELGLPLPRCVWWLAPMRRFCQVVQRAWSPVYVTLAVFQELVNLLRIFMSTPLFSMA